MLGITLNDVKIGKSNCWAKCLICKERNIFYSILQGKFIYYCLNCKKWLDVYDVK
jgi:hypothetical protein